MKAVLLVIVLFMLMGVAYALECNNESIQGVDCNITALVTPDTTSCDLNVFHTDSTLKEDETAMIDGGNLRYFYTFNDTNNGWYVYTVRCVGNTVAHEGGSIKVVDNNISSYVDTIAFDVWNYAADIGDNVLQQIFDAVWGLDSNLVTAALRYINGIMP